jgi:hypothetical protein
MRACLNVLAALAALIATPALADRAGGGVADPRAFVSRTYAAYARSSDATPPEQRSAYSARLSRLFIDYDRAWSGGDEVGSLDFDWWVNAQDWEISNVRVSEGGDGPARRTVTARWRNMDRSDSSRFLFVRWHGRWYLDDVINGSGSGDHGWTLSALLRERP